MAVAVEDSAVTVAPVEEPVIVEHSAAETAPGLASGSEDDVLDTAEAAAGEDASAAKKKKKNKKKK